MNRTSNKQFSFAVVFFWLVVLVAILIPGIPAAIASSEHSASVNQSYIGREFEFSYITQQMSNSIKTSRGKGILVSQTNELLVFQTFTPEDGSKPSFTAFPAHRLVSMHTTIGQ